MCLSISRRLCNGPVVQAVCYRCSTHSTGPTDHSSRSSMDATIFILYASFVLLLCLRLCALYWIGMERVNIFVLFLILVEMVLDILYLEWCWLWFSCMLLYLCWDMSPKALFSLGLLSWMGVGSCQRLSLHLMRSTYYLRCLVYLFGELYSLIDI